MDRSEVSVLLEKTKSSSKSAIDEDGHTSRKVAVVSLANTILGAGTLGVPLVFKLSGLGFALLMLLFAGAVATYTLFLLSKTATRVPRSQSFRSVALEAVPNLKHLVDFAIALKSIGVCSAYMIIIGDLMPPVMVHVFGVSEGSSSLLLRREFWVISVGCLLIGPLVFMRHLSALKWTSTASLVSITYLILIVIYFSGGDVVTSVFEKSTYFKFNLEAFKAIPIVVFSFTCHQNIYKIRSELRNHTPGRTLQVVLTGVLTCGSVYTSVGLFGYISFYEDVESNLLKNYDEDVWISVGRMALCLVSAFSFPLLSHPARQSIDNILFSGKSWDSPNRLRKYGVHIAESLLVFLLPMCIGVLSDDLGIVFSLTGAICSTLITYIVPSLFYLKIFPASSCSSSELIHRKLAKITASTGVVFMVTCTTVILLLA